MHHSHHARAARTGFDIPMYDLVPRAVIHRAPQLIRDATDVLRPKTTRVIECRRHPRHHLPPLAALGDHVYHRRRLVHLHEPERVAHPGEPSEYLDLPPQRRFLHGGVEDVVPEDVSLLQKLHGEGSLLEVIVRHYVVYHFHDAEFALAKERRLVVSLEELPLAAGGGGDVRRALRGALPHGLCPKFDRVEICDANYYTANTRYIWGMDCVQGAQSY